MPPSPTRLPLSAASSRLAYGAVAMTCIGEYAPIVNPQCRHTEVFRRSRKYFESPNSYYSLTPTEYFTRSVPALTAQNAITMQPAKGRDVELRAVRHAAKSFIDVGPLSTVTAPSCFSNRSRHSDHKSRGRPQTSQRSGLETTNEYLQFCGTCRPSWRANAVISLSR